MTPGAEDTAAAAGREARALVRRALTAALATRLEGAEWPYVSLVTAACDPDGAPVLLLSDLARHSRDIAAEPRVALLFAPPAADAPAPDEGEAPDPLAGPRVSVLGRARRIDRGGIGAARFLARHPAARRYAGFADFRFYRVEPARAHLVAGFGKVRWIEGADFLYRGATAALAAAEPELLAQWNADPETVRRLAGAEAGAGGEDWRLAGVDAEGADLRRGAEVRRLAFPAPAADPAAARAALARLAGGGGEG